MGLPTSVVNGEDDEDCASTVSVAPSIAHSVIDDIPRTPKKPPAFMDPNKYVNMPFAPNNYFILVHPF